MNGGRRSAIADALEAVVEPWLINLSSRRLASTAEYTVGSASAFIR